MKVSPNCCLEKEDNAFSKNKKICRSCRNAAGKKYYENNKDERLLATKQYREDNKEWYKEYYKEWFILNKEEYLKSCKEYYNNHKEEKSITAKKWRAKNRDKLNKQQREKAKNDPSFKIKRNISRIIHHQLKSLGMSKNGKSSFDYLGYSYDDLRAHIEYNFSLPGNEWMTWKNNGRYNPKTWDPKDQSTWTWQLDHIIPHSCFNYISMEEQSFRDCWALSNLRPLSALQNILDGNRR